MVEPETAKTFVDFIPEIVSIIVALISLAGVIITVRKSSNDMLDEFKKQSELSDQRLDAKLDKFQAVTDIKIEELTREVRKHNNFAEKMPAMQEQLKTIFKTLDDMKASGK